MGWPVEAWRRMALVTDVEWIAKSVALFGWMAPGELKLFDLDDLALSPQCGFASVAQGNSITPEEQRQKLALVVEVARRVWG